MTDSEILTEVYKEFKGSSFDDKKRPRTKGHYDKRQRHLGFKCLKAVKKTVKFIEKEWKTRTENSCAFDEVCDKKNDLDATEMLAEIQSSDQKSQQINGHPIKLNIF